MQVRIHSHGFHLDNDLRRDIERRMEYSLARFGERVHGVHVWLTDENGPRGGVDKAVRLEVGLAGGRGLRVAKVAETWQAAVDIAAGRMGRACARELERRRDRRVSHEFAGLAR
jgi:putative sigma-54 modulation protein